MPKDAEPALFSDGELAPAPDSISRAAFDSWNEQAKKFGWAKAQFLTSGRPSKLRRAVKDVGGLIAWSALLAKCGESDFLCGRTQSKDRKPFNFTMDWALEPRNLLKLMEGNFLPKGPDVPIAVVGPQKIAWRTILDVYRPGRFWASSFGPRPEDRGCRAPDEFLVPWREKHGIGASVPAETPQQRLAGLILSLRNAGHWDRANVREIELAAMEGRPPTLVPAPDAQDPDVVPPPPARQNGTSAPHVNFSAQKRGPVSDALDLSPPDWDEIPEGDPAMAEP